MRLIFGPLRLDPPLQTSSPLDVLASVVSEFEVWAGERVLLREDSFPIVELAGALQRWSREPPVHRRNFEFDSMDFDEPGAYWIRREGSGWRVGSLPQEFPDATVRSLDVIDVSIRDLVNRLEVAARAELGLDLFPVWRFLAVA